MISLEMKSIIEKIPRNPHLGRVNLPGRVLVAHQAEFMPWLGLISKASMGDLYLILDNTQFKTKDFQNRNKIRFPNNEGWIWLQVPVDNRGYLQNMLEVTVSDNTFRAKHLKTIKTSYSRSLNFCAIYPEIEDLYQFATDKLAEFNINIIQYALRKFGVEVPIFRVSELQEAGLPIDGAKNQLILSMCKAVNADVLVLGSGGKQYVDLDLFSKNNVKVVFQKFNHPLYRQHHEGFLPCMSFIDALFSVEQDDYASLIQQTQFEETL